MDYLTQFDQLVAAIAGGALVWLLNQKTERDRRKLREASRFDQSRRELYGEFAGWGRLLGGRIASLMDAGTAEESVSIRDELIESLYHAGKLEAEISLVTSRDQVRQGAAAVMAAATTFTFDSLPIKWEVGLERVAEKLPPQMKEWQAELDIALEFFMEAAREELRVGAEDKTRRWFWRQKRQ